MRTARRARAWIMTLAVLSVLAACAGTGQPPGTGTPAPSGVMRGPADGRPGDPAATPAGSRLPGATAAGTVPPVVTHGPRTGHRVALTFDADMTDGMLAKLAADPHLSYANVTVVDILQRERVPATFFLTGEWVQRYPELTRRLAADHRFELANHTWRHSAFTKNCYDLPVLPPADRVEDVRRTFAIVDAFGGRRTRYFRFPGGCYDTAALRTLAPLGLTVVGWDVVSGDPFATASAPIVHAVLSRVRPGSIVVMHLTEANARYTDDALPAILAGLHARGLVPVTVSELLASDAVPAAR